MTYDIDNGNDHLRPAGISYTVLSFFILYRRASGEPYEPEITDRLHRSRSVADIL